MAMIQFYPIPAINPATGLPDVGLRGLTGQVVQPGTNTPVSIWEDEGKTVTILDSELTITEALFTPGFWADTFESLEWFDGTWRLPLYSPVGLKNAALAAQAAAEAVEDGLPALVDAAAAPAVAAAEAAAASVADIQAAVDNAGIALPAGGTVGDVLYRDTAERTGVWGPAPTGSGGPADWTTLLNKPTTFPPDAHTHTSGNISDASVVGRALLTAADAAAARTAIAAAPSSVVSFPGLSATDPTKAAPGGHVHSAATVTFAPSGALTATNVQDALVQASTLGGSGSGSSIRVYTYRSGTYPTLPTTKPGGVELVFFLGPVQATSLPSWIGTGASQVPAIQFYVATS